MIDCEVHTKESALDPYRTAGSPSRRSGLPGRSRSAGILRGTGRFLGACVVLLVFSRGAGAAEAVVAPDFSLVAADGSTVQLNEETREQKATVLFFWATWCPYCKALMPHLQSMRLEYGDDIEILAINIMEDGKPVEFIDGAGYDFTLLLNGDAVADAYGITGTPGVLVVDRERVVHLDLRQLPPLAPPANVSADTHRGKAAYLAPYWAAEIRKSIDAVLNGST